MGQCILSQSTKLCKAPVPVAMETRKALSCFTVLPTVTVMRLNERWGGGGGGDEAIISEEYTEPGFWSSCFRMFPETCTSGLHLQRKYSARGTLRL